MHNPFTLFQSSSDGYMVAFAGKKYAARSPPVFVANISYTVTGFTLVRPRTVQPFCSSSQFLKRDIYITWLTDRAPAPVAALQVLEFQKGTLQNLFWKPGGCSSCSGRSDFACVDGSCAIKTTSCRGKGGQVDCNPGIQLAFSGTDKHEAVLNSWYEVSKLRQYSLFGLFSNLKDSLTSQFSSFF